MIAIIGAMDEEISKLLSDMMLDSTSTYAKITFYKGRLYGCDCVICKSGVGKVNAALCTQTLIDNYNPNYIINTGVAGAIDDSLDIGDIVISTCVLEHDVDVTALGYKKSEIPDMTNSRFEANQGIVDLAYNISVGIMDAAKVTRGLIVTGDQFISSTEDKKRLQDEFDPLCTEMEGGAIAHVASINNIPFIIIRSISDNADSLAIEDYPAFVKKATDNSTKILKELLPNLIK